MRRSFKVENLTIILTIIILRIQKAWYCPWCYDNVESRGARFLTRNTALNVHIGASVSNLQMFRNACLPREYDCHGIHIWYIYVHLKLVKKVENQLSKESFKIYLSGNLSLTVQPVYWRRLEGYFDEFRLTRTYYLFCLKAGLHRFSSLLPPLRFSLSVWIFGGWKTSGCFHLISFFLTWLNGNKVHV